MALPNRNNNSIDRGADDGQRPAERGLPKVRFDERQTSYTSIRSDIAAMVPKEAISILDVGCSNGALGAHLKSLLPTRNVFGIELDKAFAKVASHTLDGVVNADVNAMDWRAVFRGHKFDCIIFADVLEHLVDPEGCLRMAQQRLAPGGCVIVSLPNVRHVSALWSIFVKGTFPRLERGIFDRSHLHWFTYADARNLLIDNGLKVSTESYAMRCGDRGGGLINRALNRLPVAVKKAPPIREFFAYQICYRAEVLQPSSSETQRE